MAKLKLFGSSRGAAHMAQRGGKKENTAGEEKAPRQKKPLKTIAILLAVILFLEGLYFFCIYTNNAFVKKYRTIYITTAMNTMTHQWLATYFIPADVIDTVMYDYGMALGEAIGKESSWSRTEQPEAADPGAQAASSQEGKPVSERPVEIENIPSEKEPSVSVIVPEDMSPEEIEAMARNEFYQLFWELDQDSFDRFVAANPEVLENGWDQIHINEAGFEDDGIDAYTIYDEQVLGIDAENGVLLVRVKGTSWRGVLAIAKDPAMLNIEMSAYIGSYGQTCAEIAESHDGILSMNANAFWDEDEQGNQGNGNGGIIAGYTRSNGTAYGDHFTAWGYKRLELHEDNLMYIKDVGRSVSSDCTDCCEFAPAMIIDGKQIVDYGYTGTQPRAAIGQSDKYEILMMVIEGRQTQSLGTDVNTCIEIMMQHHCMQAMNLDGGSSAMLWFDGKECISSSSKPLRYYGGRPLPNAWVYHSAGWTPEE